MLSHRGGRSAPRRKHPVDPFRIFNPERKNRLRCMARQGFVSDGPDQPDAGFRGNLELHEPGLFIDNGKPQNIPVEGDAGVPLKTEKNGVKAFDVQRFHHHGTLAQIFVRISAQDFHAA